jgi:tetratricopeptide (TPR) repeat protein
MVVKEGPPDPAAKRSDQSWLVWILLVVVGAFAVFTATRSAGTHSRAPVVSKKPAKAHASSAPGSSVGVAPRSGPALGADPKQLLEQGCPDAQANDCACREKTVRRALTLGAPDSAVSLVEGAAAPCRATAALQGLLAEARVRSGNVDDALALLSVVEKLDAKSPSLPYVRAVAALKRGDSPTAAREATQAIDWGRGAPAHVARALASFQDGELDAAEASLKRALESAPDDVDALYNLAVIDQRRNHYTPARSGYLRVLRLRPDHLDARLNLALLVIGAGAIEEARHHQRKLEQQAPSGDPRVAKLSAALSKAPSAPAPIVRPKQ